MNRGHLLHAFPPHDGALNNRQISPFRYPLDSNSERYPQRRIFQAIRPLSLSRAHNGRTEYGRNLGWSIDFAVAYLVRYLEENALDLSVCLAKIRLKAQHTACAYGYDGIVFRSFEQLDKLLFAGQLNDAVYLAFDSFETDASGATFARGPNPRVRRISIVLNLDIHQRANAGHVLASLIHHMIHAYFLVACGPQEEGGEDYGCLSHGIHFAKVMRTIKSLSGLRDRPLPIGFGHPLHSRSYFNEYNPRPLPRKSDWFCSHCFPDVDPVPGADVDKYYDTVCKPLLDLPDVTGGATVLVYNKREELEEVPRAVATPSARSVQFILEEKDVVLVPEEKLEPFLSIRRAFDQSRSCYLEVPKKVTREAFLSLLQLLHTGTYGPDHGPVIPPTARKYGPPVIKPVQPNTPAYLLTDVGMFRLGCEMSFEECKVIALDRLNAQHSMREDPIAVLQAIYKGGDPDNEIRDWVKKFLVRAPDGESWTSIGGGGLEPPNLVKLEQSLDLKERWFNLLETSSALQIDVMKAKDHLVKIGRFGSPSRELIPQPFPSLSANQGMHMSVGLPGVGASHNQSIQNLGRIGMGLGLDKYRAAGMDSPFGTALRYIGMSDRLEEWI